MGFFSDAQGQLTLLSVVGSGRISNSCKLLCMSVGDLIAITGLLSMPRLQEGVTYHILFRQSIVWYLFA